MTLIFLLSACASTETAALSNSAVISDCFWSATAVAFLDANENGRFDPDELPLEGIEFILDPADSVQYTIRITFSTANGSLLTVDGLLNPLGFVLPMGIPPAGGN